MTEPGSYPEHVCWSCGCVHGAKPVPIKPYVPKAGVCDICGHGGQVLEADVFGGLLDCWRDMRETITETPKETSWMH